MSIHYKSKINLTNLINKCIEEYNKVPANLTAKLVIIPDLHGQSIWKDIINVQPDADYYVFLGDELDSYFININDQIENFLEINKFQEALKTRVVRLLANHTAHYIYEDAPIGSGFQPVTAQHLLPMRENLKQNFKMSFAYGNYLFTHAGVTKQFLKLFSPNIQDYGESVQNPGYTTLISNSLNLALLSKEKRKLLFAVGKDRGGYDECSGPLWVDKGVLELDIPENFHQIVGHSRIENKVTVRGINPSCSVTFIDTLPSKSKPDLDYLGKYYYLINTRDDKYGNSSDF